MELLEVDTWTSRDDVANANVDAARIRVPERLVADVELYERRPGRRYRIDGIVPHFTGPIATAARAHALSTFPFTVVFEYNLSFSVKSELRRFGDVEPSKARCGGSTMTMSVSPAMAPK